MTLDTCEKEIQAVADPESIQPIADGTFVSNMDANVQRFQLDLDILDLQIPTQQVRERKTQGQKTTRNTEFPQQIGRCAIVCQKQDS